MIFTISKASNQTDTSPHKDSYLEKLYYLDQ
jgi:hypothetical protein